MKQEWIEKKLGDLCEIELGKTPYRGDKSFWDKDKVTSNVWLSIADLLNTNGKIVSDSKEYITDKAVKLSKIVRKGTLLLSFKLTLGRLAFAGRDLFTNEAIASLVIKNDKEIDKNFLYQFLVLFDWNKATEGDHKVKGRTLNKAKLKEIVVRYPKSIKEQQRIVSILDKLFADIEKAKNNAEQNLKNAREFFESYLQSVFTNKGEDWEEDKICDVCELKSGTTISPSLEREIGDVLYTKVSDMTLPDNLVEINTSNRFVNSEEIKMSQIIPKGSIIFPKRGGAIATNKKRKIIKPTIVDLNTMAIIPSKKIDKDFLFYWFSLIDLNDLSNGTSIPQINNYSFDEVYISYPISLKEQSVLVKRFEELSTETKKLEAIYEQKLKDLEELKKSVLQKAFNGEL